MCLEASIHCPLLFIPGMYVFKVRDRITRKVEVYGIRLETAKKSDHT